MEDQDPFDAYIEGAITWLTNVDNVYLWWNDPTNPHHPLRDLAFDVLSIPAMSAEVERAFSSAKRLVTPDRGSLNEQTIEMRELLKNWWNSNAVAQRR